MYFLERAALFSVLKSTINCLPRQQMKKKQEQQQQSA